MWFHLPHSREVRWFGQAKAGPEMLGKQWVPVRSTGRRGGDQRQGCVVESPCQGEQGAFTACRPCWALASMLRGLEEGHF